eukprot:1088686-Pyramimonas_sp.AAC.1
MHPSLERVSASKGVLSEIVHTAARSSRSDGLPGRSAPTCRQPDRDHSLAHGECSGTGVTWER